MKDKIFRNTKAGDWVFHKSLGWLKVAQVEKEGMYSFKAGGISYDANGRYHTTDKYPTLLLHNPFDPDDRPPVEFKIGEVIVVRDHEDDEWKLDKFTGMEDAKCSFGGRSGAWKYARKLTAEEKGE